MRWPFPPLPAPRPAPPSNPARPGTPRSLQAPRPGAQGLCHWEDCSGWPTRVTATQEPGRVRIALGGPSG